MSSKKTYQVGATVKFEYLAYMDIEAGSEQEASEIAATVGVDDWAWDRSDCETNIRVDFVEERQGRDDPLCQEK